MGGQGFVQSGSQRRAVGRILGLQSLEDLAISTHHELGEVPLDVVARAIAGGDQPLVKARLVVPFHGDFAEHGEGNAVFRGAEFLDFRIRTRFLLSEVIGGKANHDQTFLLVLFEDGLKSFVLRCEATLTGDVHHKDNLPLEFVKVDLVTVNIGHCKVVKALGRRVRHNAVDGE